MRALSLFAALLLAGCFGGREPASSSGVGSVAAVAGGLVVLAVATGALAPQPVASDEAGTEFDFAEATKALEAVEYIDCGRGSVADLTVLFRNDGDVDRVTIDPGALEPEVAQCVAGRFARVTVPSFSGPSRAVRCRIRLSGG
jgi:hypothetical protein